MSKYSCIELNWNFKYFKTSKYGNWTLSLQAASSINVVEIVREATGLAAIK